MLQPRRVFVFEKVKAAVAADTYVEGYLRELKPDWEPDALRSVVAECVRAHRLALEHPVPLGNDEQVLARIPTGAEAALRTHQQELLAWMRKNVRHPAAERVVHDEVSLLIDDWNGLRAGTVAYRRETSGAVMLFALPYSVLDFASGTFTGHVPARAMLRAAAANDEPPLPDTAVTVIDSALQICSTLVWALPEPFGAIGAGILSLVEILFGVFGHDHRSPVIEAIENAVDTLQRFIQQQNVEDKENDVILFQEWLGRQSEVLDAIEENPGSYIRERILPPLDRMLAPGAGTLPKALITLEQLFQKCHLAKVEDYKEAEALLGVLVSCVSVYFWALRMRLVLGIKLAAHLATHGDDEAADDREAVWRGDYADFLAVLRGSGDSKGWPDRIDAYVATLMKGRFDHVKLEHLAEEGHYVGEAVGTSTHRDVVWHWQVDRPAGWGFVDDVAKVTRLTAADDPGQGCCPKAIEHRDQAEALRQKYLDEVGQRFDKLRDVVKRWRASANDWYDHQPPSRPKTKPTVATDWSGRTPSGARWVKGNAVQYALKFSNNRGPSPIGEWTDFVEIGDAAFPLLTDLPTDPLDMATRILVYRRFRSDGKMQCIARIPVKDRTFRDTVP